MCKHRDLSSNPSTYVKKLWGAGVVMAGASVTSVLWGWREEKQVSLLITQALGGILSQRKEVESKTQMASSAFHIRYRH